MWFKRMGRLIALAILLASCCLETGGRLLNKDPEKLTAKFRRGLQHDFQRDFHNVRGQWAQSVQERNESFSIDEQDAILFQYIIANLIQSLQQSISVVSSLIRICGDTLAGVMSGMVKATGGLLNLSSKVLYYVSAKLEASQEHSPAFLGNLSSNCAFGLKKAAPILHYAGEACIYSGEILESMTLGLGEAVQDSFWGLEVVSNSSNVIISFLLQIDEVDSIASMKNRVANSISSSVSEDADTSVSAASVPNSTHSSSSVRHIRNILHTRPHTDPTMHVLDPSKPYKSSIDVKLGKEWIAPSTATISVHDQSAVITEAADALTGDVNSLDSDHSSNPIHNHTTYNATNLVLKVRQVWNALLNKTVTIARQFSNHTHTVYLADAASSTIVTEKDSDIDDPVLEPVLPLKADKNTHYLSQELALLHEYLTHAVSLSYRILQALTTLAIQLYTTVVAAQNTESSQGAFFLLALIATYIISIIPFQSMRTKIITLICFATLVYCSFITTEQIQRGKLIHSTSVQSAHSLLLQQAQQRHHRSIHPKLYDNVIRDSNSIYSDVYAEVSTTGEVYVHKEDVITSPHYEHTPTQDVYSNINHNTLHATSSTNYTDQSIPDNTTFTNSTTTLLFDDAIWLNTLLTSLWDVNDPHFNTQGLGAYLNEVYAEYVNIELNNIPPSVANIRLKSFDLGRAAPLFKGVRVFRVRDHACMKQSINAEFGTGAAGNKGNPIDKTTSTDINSTTSNTSMKGGNGDSTNNDSMNGLEIHDTVLAKLWHSIEKHGNPFWGTNGSTEEDSNSTSSTYNSQHSEERGAGSSSTSDSSVESDGSTPTTAVPDITSTPASIPATPATSTANNVPSATAQSALLSPYKHILSQFSAECDSLIIEMDTVFLSSDMNIVLSLRQALKSALPEITATLSEVSLTGQLRLKVKLTPDYPFVGDGQLSFLSAPQLGFSLSSLGGIELSSVPYAFYWVNSSMHYVLEQYTAPQYMELDLRHTLCSTCDLPLVPAHDIVKVFKNSLSTAMDRLKHAADKARVLWSKVYKSGRKWAAQLQHISRLALQHLQRGVRHVQHTIDAHTAHTLRTQDNTVPSGDSDVHLSGDGGEGAGTNQRALHFTRYKSFETIEESDMYPELKKEETNRREGGGKELLSQASALLQKGRAKLKETFQNIGNDRSVNELMFML